jgi:hypothetical protein
MKPIAKSLVCLLFCFSVNFCFSQNWAPPQAQWYYSFMNVAPVSAYVKIINLGDTIIGSNVCNKLQKRRIGVDLLNGQAFDVVIGHEYTFEQNEIVFIRNNSNWDTLYNFNSNIGDSWAMAKPSSFNFCDSARIFVVDTGSILVNGNQLKFKKINYQYNSNSSDVIVDTIVEKIGSLNYYFLPFDNCVAMIDANEGGNLRCYQDNNLGLFNKNTSVECDFVVATTKRENALVSINNPVNEKLHFNNLELVESYQYKIFNSSGAQIENARLHSSEIDFTKFSPGIYFVALNNSTSNVHFKVIKLGF